MKRHKTWKLSELLEFTLLSFVVSSAILIPLASDAQGQSIEFYAFSNSKCPPCVEIMSQLRSDFPEAGFIVHELENNTAHFQKILACLNESLGREVVPPLPLIGAFNSSHLKAVSGGSLSVEKWKTLLSTRSDEVSVYFETLGGGVYINESIRSVETIALLEGLFKKALPDTGDGQVNALSLLVPVVVAAVVDAVNPCAFNTFLVFLAYAMYNVGKSGVLKVGLSFALAVFIVYFLLGLGLLRFLGYVPYVKYLVAIFAGTMGALRIIQFLGVKVKYIPTSLGDKLSERLQYILSPTGGFIAGALTASLILPCSSAPYFVVLDLLSRNTASLAGLTLLGIYNLIIIAPFLAITLGIHALSAATMDVRLWTKTHEKWINLAMGIALLGLSLFVLI